MEEQQPGQTFTPQGSQSPEARQTQTTSEISEIDAAVSANPSQADSSAIEAEDSPSLQPSIAEAPVAPSPLPEQDEGDSTEQKMLISWAASDSSAKSGAHMKAILVMGSVGIAFILLTALILGYNFGAILATVAVLLGLIALYLVNNKQGRLEEYQLYEGGVGVAGKFYSYNEVQSFGFVDGSKYDIELIPVKRFQPVISLHLDPATADEAIDTLSLNVPREDREPDFIDRFYKKLGL